MQSALAGLDTAPDTHSKIALIPPNYFVWSDELEVAYQTYHHYVSERPEYEDELDPHPYNVFDMDPATHPYDDLLSECPKFTSNPDLTGEAPPTMQESNKHKTQDKYARWQARANHLHKENPNKSKSWIAGRIAREPIAEDRDSETIRRNITLIRR
jgi:hypothetical protein